MAEFRDEMKWAEAMGRAERSAKRAEEHAEKYQSLRDIGVAEYEIETRIGEGWTLDQMIEEAREGGYEI